MTDPDPRNIHFLAERATKPLCGVAGDRRLTSNQTLLTCEACRRLMGMPPLAQEESDFDRKADIQKLITAAEDSYARLEILISHHRTRYQHFIDEAREAGDPEMFTIYEWQDENGNFVIAPILVAQAQSLHTVALLRAEVNQINSQYRGNNDPHPGPMPRGGR